VGEVGGVAPPRKICKFAQRRPSASAALPTPAVRIPHVPTNAKTPARRVRGLAVPTGPCLQRKRESCDGLRGSRGIGGACAWRGFRLWRRASGTKQGHRLRHPDPRCQCGKICLVGTLEFPYCACRTSGRLLIFWIFSHCIGRAHTRIFIGFSLSPSYSGAQGRLGRWLPIGLYVESLEKQGEVGLLALLQAEPSSLTRWASVGSPGKRQFNGLTTGTSVSRTYLTSRPTEESMRMRSYSTKSMGSSCPAA